MLQQPIYSLFIRMIPENFLVIYSICLLTNSKINYKRLLISSIIGGTTLYLIRLLPIHFGVHTILIIMLNIFLAVKLNEVEIHKAIAGALIAVIICFIADITLIFVYTKVLQFPSELVLSQSFISVIACSPSLIIFYLLTRLISRLKGMRVKYEQY